MRYRGVPRSPRGHKNPRGSRLAVCSLNLHRMRCGPSCQWRGVCPRHRDCGDSGTGLRPFRRPRRRQPTTLPVAARWMAAPYHAVTRAARKIFLSRSLPPLARRPLLPPVTTRSPHFTPHRRSGSDRRPPRLEPHPSPRRPRAFAPVRVVQSGRHLRAIGGGRGGHGNAPSRARSGPREADRMGGAWRRCARNARSYRRGRPSRTSSSGSAAQRRPPESRGRIPGANTSETAGRLAGTMLRTTLSRADGSASKRRRMNAASPGTARLRTRDGRSHAARTPGRRDSNITLATASCPDPVDTMRPRSARLHLVRRRRTGGRRGLSAAQRDRADPNGVPPGRDHRAFARDRLSGAADPRFGRCAGTRILRRFTPIGAWSLPGSARKQAIRFTGVHGNAGWRAAGDALRRGVARWWR